MMTSAVVGEEEGAITRTDKSTRRHVLQDFLVVWLDSSSSILNDEFHRQIAALRRIVNDINRFTDIEQCIHFLKKTLEEKVFLIVSPTLAERIVARVHPLTQVDSIYLFSDEQMDKQSWIDDWSKVKGIFNEMEKICSLVKEVADRWDADSISISVLSTDHIGEKSINELEPSFMYTEVLKEILLQVDYNEKTFADFINYCRPLLTKSSDLESLIEFEKKYHCKDVIWWYTCECFIYRFLNKFLRDQEIGSIIKMGFFIRDLHQQLFLLHSEQLGKELPSILTVYRGQSVPLSDFEKIVRTPNGLLSFNCFLSTSSNRAVCLNFGNNKENKPGRVSVLFEMTIDTETPSSPYALISQLSYFQSEEEILFAAHTVFRVGQIIQMEDGAGRWLVKLTLISSTNSDLNTLTEYLRKETIGSTGWHRLGILLMKIAEYDKAEQVYQELLIANESDENEKALIYHQLGWVKRKLGLYEEALAYYEKAMEIRQKIFPSAHPDVASSYNTIGDAYRGMGDHPKALHYYQKGLEIRQNSLSSDHPDLAISYNNLGDTYNDLSNYTEALSFYKKGRLIRQASLPSNHPDLATSHNNIGDVYCNMGEYSQAQACYQIALEISEKTLPSDHPDLATFYNNLGMVYHQLSDYTKALSYYDKALSIWMKKLNRNHSILFNVHSNMGTTYLFMGQYQKALDCYEQALTICHNSRPQNHVDFGICYNNIGQAYYKMGQYEKALSFYEKDLEISKAVLPENHLDFTASYNSMGLLNFSLGNYAEALSFYEKALEIFEKDLHLNHPDLIAIYKNMGNVYTNLGTYSQALAYHEKALEICLTTLSDNHPNLATSYNNIGLVKFHLGEHQTAQSYLEKALKIREEVLPSNHPDLISSYDNLAFVCNALGNLQQALTHYKKSFEIYEKVFPLDHPSLANYYTHLGTVQRNLHNYSEAIASFEKAFELRKKTHSLQHPELLALSRQISEVYKAFSLQEQTMNINQHSHANEQLHNE